MTAPFGRVKPVEESKNSPVPLASDQFLNRWVSFPFRHPESMHAGAMTMTSPRAVRSSRKSGLAAQSRQNASADARSPDRRGTIRGMVLRLRDFDAGRSRGETLIP